MCPIAMMYAQTGNRCPIMYVLNFCLQNSPNFVFLAIIGQILERKKLKNIKQLFSYKIVNVLEPNRYKKFQFSTELCLFQIL